MTGSAATAPSSCCWTNQRCTACRRTRWCRHGTRARCGATRGWQRRRWLPWRCRHSRGGADERLREVGPRTKCRGETVLMREQLNVPRAEFRSYYGRPVLKQPVWEWHIAAYLFAGGLSAGSAVLGGGADLTQRPALRKVSRVGALVSIVASLYYLVSDLGRPERFH